MIKNAFPKVGVVGCGYWGQNLVRNFAELGSLAAICDVDESRVMEMSGKLSVKGTTRFQDMLDDSELQGLVIAAPAAQHFQLAKSTMLAGKDVFVEKPLALRVEEGEELVAIARRHSRILMVGHLLHYHPAIVELRRILLNGELGKVEYISSSRLNFGKVRTEEDILWSFAPHDISAILHLLNEKPTRVTAQGSSNLNHPLSDVTLTNLTFGSGVKAHIFVSWLHPFKEQRLVIVGDQKMAVFDDTQADEKLVLYPHRINWINRVPVAKKADREIVNLSKDEPLKVECTHFLECIKEQKRPRTDGENGVEVLKILHAAGQSMNAHGQPVLMDEKRKPLHFAHATAIVDEGCEIGEGTKIWHFSHVMSDTQIGNHCNFGQNVFIASGTRIGDNVKVQNNVSIYTGVEIEDDVFCGPSMVFTNVMTPRSHVNRKSEYLRTLIKRGASMGANSTIVCGVTIGRYAFIGAGAVVTRDVPDYALMVGVPARQIGWVCQCGIRLEVSSELATCESCGSSYILNDGMLLAVPTTTRPPQIAIPRVMAATAGSD
ncbi:MAG TPA: Gfo/Idh/MocA family oxidoreductase [Candidatus Saccharimonadales bacterium]|jgi:UDP-2-acetamido-3-amino-2,3-dideoxy-glucuronate N-acetyltransferase|nr:Gfo/Idh/MocA family oxidoreductase [Candidatus Saccharimonadales bacterium]